MTFSEKKSYLDSRNVDGKVKSTNNSMITTKIEHIMYTLATEGQHQTFL